MPSEGIAIIGIAAQLPSGISSTEDLGYSSFWDFLVNGGQACVPLADVEFDPTQFESKSGFPEQGAFLKNAASFDHISFGISARDARVMPYSARRLMELSLHALADSGIDSRGQKIGCFMSGSTGTGGRGLNTDGSLAWVPSALANRISYILDITGPSMQLDTACSSSLTALHVAIGAIERGDCTAALVGAAQVDRDLSEWKAYVQGGVLSPDGKSKPFDLAADGFGRAEGAIVIVLKSLQAALEDNDHVYSVIRGSAINSTGSSMPLYVPSGFAQQQCIAEAYRRASRDPKDVDYVELHATGTSVGDPIETNAAGEIFGRDEVTVVGSVKGNIGHLEVAAFLASLVKACLILEHGMIPPTVNVSNLSSYIHWAKYRLDVPAEPTTLGCRSPTGRSLISISSSGIGGATGHVVLEAPPPPNTPIVPSRSAPALCVVGGLSPKAVEEISQSVCQLLAEDPASSHEIAVTVARRARQLPWRAYFIWPMSPGEEIPSAVLMPAPGPQSLAFVFSGQGPQHLKMGCQLFAEYPVFRKTVLQLDDVYRRLMGSSLIETTGLFAPIPHPRILLHSSSWPVTITVSAIAMIQIAMFDLLKSVGVVPDLMVGHSAGETAIVYASGAGPKEMAMEIAIARGEAMSGTEGDSFGMATLACDTACAAKLIAEVVKEHGGVLEVSCINAPESVSVSGTAIQLENIVALAQQKGLFAQRIRTLVPGHSSFMDCIKADYLSRMRSIFERYPGTHAPTIPVFSTCRDRMLVDSFTPEYFWDNCRNGVQFCGAISSILADSSPIFLEISCHSVLAASVMAQGVPETRILCPMRRPSTKKSTSGVSDEQLVFSSALGRLSLLGYNALDLSGLYGASTYKPESIKHPLAARVISAPPPTLVNTVHSDFGPLSLPNLELSQTSHPDLAQHVVYGEPVLPATGFIDLLLESGANFLWDVEFISVLALSAARSIDVRLEMVDSSWFLKSKSTAPHYRENARGFSDNAAPLKVTAPLDFQSIWQRLPPLSFDGFYSSLDPCMTFGPKFQRIVRCHGGPIEVLAEIRGPTFDELSEGYALHPIVLDACLHVMLHSDISKEPCNDITYLPSKLDHFIFYRRKLDVGNWFSHIRLRQWMPDSKSYDVLVTDSSGIVLCEFHNLTVRKFSSAAPPTIERRFELVSQPFKMIAPIPTFSPTFPEHPDKYQVNLLFEALDRLSFEMISKSLERGVSLGSDVSRRRYLEFSEYAVRNHVQKIPEKRTGRLTRNLVKELNDHDDVLVEYTVTDTSFALVAELATALPYSTVIPRSYDISKPALDQGFHSEYYDFIVALHVLHTVPDVKRCLSSLQTLLVPGGCLLIVELDGSSWTSSGHIWFDCVFGTFPEWFSYKDGRTHCTLAPEAWKDRLEETGFINIQTSVERGGTGHEFFFAAQKPISPLIVLPLSSQSLMRTFAYRFGDEMALRKYLLTLDTELPETLYLLTMQGRDADSALGLCSAIAKELRPWAIRLAIFESASHFSDPIPLISQHIGIFESGDNIVSFSRGGLAHVPRVVLANPPPSIGLADGPSHDPHYVEVEILHWFAMSASFGSFIGRITRSQHLKFSAGDLITGLTESAAADILRVAVGSIVALGQEKATSDVAAESATVVLSRLLSSHLPRMGQVAMAIDEQKVVVIIEHCARNNSSIQLQHPIFKDPHPPYRFDVLISDSETLSQYPHLRRWVPRTGKILLWDSLLRDAVSDDPDWIHDTLDADLRYKSLAMPNVRSHSVFTKSGVPTSPPIQPPEHRASPPFRHDRSYILLGGIGGLGIDLAHGARYLVLTSRRGIASLDPIHDALTLAKVEYLKCQEDLVLALEPCDAMDKDATRALIDSIQVLVAGCFQMTLVLSEALFLNLTEEALHLVQDSKVKVFETFAAEVDITSLDFFVSLSSFSGLFGLVGESIYSSACTALDGALARYPNAFSLIAPGIRDAGYVARRREKDGVQIAVSISAEYLWLSLEDGLRKLDHEPFDRYIPDVDWNHIDANFILPMACRHLTVMPSRRSTVDKTIQRKSDREILTRVLELLEVSQSDFDTNQPLTTYGLDSISAAKLSSIIHPYASVSQIQLLGGISWAQIMAASDHVPTSDSTGPPSLGDMSAALKILLSVLGMTEDDLSPNIPLSSYGLDSLGASRLALALKPYIAVTQMQLMGQMTWGQLGGLIAADRGGPARVTRDDALVELCAGLDHPLILLPGADGSIALFFALQNHFQGGLWAIQLADAIQHAASLTALVTFCEQKIREKLPRGPYRLAAYSASNILAVALAKALETTGERVVQLTFIDYFPLIWSTEVLEALVRDRYLAEIELHQAKNVVDMLRADPFTRPADIEDYLAAMRGRPEASPNNVLAVKASKALMALIVDFLRQLYPLDGPRTHGAFTEAMVDWMAAVRAPMNVLVAEHGILKAFPGPAWLDLGASQCAGRKAVQVHSIPGVGHYGIFKNKSVSPILEKWDESES
ncbi:hypothetical protein DFH08DRAFT_1073196 [Mycena albidolilacea]|uniref:Polyketide synthase n=1 Tax=Mycena albidolilacea TaxID=1033008 RepID=A0AAD7F4F0_9AGAR|nr:hypothetical protein DFH08DRAFT_1073196 [Mycena albidolilacea]